MLLCNMNGTPAVKNHWNNLLLIKIIITYIHRFDICGLTETGVNWGKCECLWSTL